MSIDEILAARDPADDPIRGDNGYPHEEETERIRLWKIVDNDDFHAVMSYVAARWKYPDYWEVHDRLNTIGQPEKEYVFSTGGWSGNESLVLAIEQNAILQMVGAQSWVRGGHYVYRFPL